MGILEIWKEAKEKIKAKIGDTSFETWVSSTQVKEDKNCLVLEVPDKFFKDWLETYYLEIIKECVVLCGYKGEIKLKINPYILKPSTKSKFSQLEFQFQETQDSLHLNPRYTFENFVVGNSNKFAHAACLAVANSPGKTYNPLFIYGGVGLGKTHLLQAIAHRIKGRFMGAKILYISAEDFTNQLIKSIQAHSTERFRNKFRNLNVLLIDDIQFLGGKESTQEEFFHTFNVLYDSHKQIVISSDRPPKELPRMEERLVSRFNWGLVVDIQPPDYETRLAILRKKIENEPIKVPSQVLEFIAEKITTNIRELEGALVRVFAYSLIENKPITLELTKEVLKDMLKEAKLNISVDKIKKKVAEYFNIPFEELRSKKRSKTFLFPRQIAIYLIRKLTDFSLPEIAKFFGKKDHTTVLHSINKIEELIKKDLRVKNIILEIENEIKRV